MRRGRFYAGRLWLWLNLRIAREERRWFGQLPLPIAHDDHACLCALEALWNQARADRLPPP